LAIFAQPLLVEITLTFEPFGRVLKIFALVCSVFAATKCTSDALNVRATASTKAKILRTLPKGSKVNVISTSNGWAKIANGQFVSTQFLKACGTAPKPTSKPKPGPKKPTTKPGPKKPTTKPTPSGGVLSLGQLKAIMPRLSSSKANAYIGYLNSGMREAHITTCPRKAAFLAQLAHESAQLIYFEELASGAAYEGRRDLGNTHPGDGRRYKGRGPIQLTGRNNYRAAGKALGLPLEANPKMVATPAVGFRTSLWFWTSHGLSKYADSNTQSGFDTITRRINGGYNGKADRDQYWRKARKVLGC